MKAPRDSLRGVLLFGTTIFAGAFLIFLVQPMVAKRIVPWFGGTPGVWSLCLAFYQSALFLGYGYAHLLFARVPASRQLAVHAVLLASALALLPVLPDGTWKPVDAHDPSARILAMLAANVALPFVALASTGPLLQAWFSRAYPGRAPYPLYALSNLGSVLALLVYPFLIEPNVSLSTTSHGWSWGFILCSAGVLSCAWLAAQRTTQASHPADSTDDSKSARAQTFSGDPLRTLLWVALPACAVVIFMAISNEMCLDVASAPFLWVVPLCVYLSTFILCFASERLYPRGFVIALALILAGTLTVLGDQSPLSAPGTVSTAPVYAQIGGYCLVLFVCCMLLHGELYRLRPAPQQLTAYYLCISGGGAAGGLFVGLLAPQIFSSYDELPLGLAAGWILVLIAWWRDPSGVLRSGRWRLAWAAAACVSLTAVLVGVGLRAGIGPNVVLQERNFYGVLRVFNTMGWQPARRQVVLRNGTTRHGFQLVDDGMRRVPTDYYGSMSGVGIALSNRNPGRPLKVGVIGLGIGTLAAYGEPGDLFKFYEINPDVVRIARDAGYFSFLSDSKARIEVIVGDGRLSLESELRADGGEQYDLLVLDAFNSDSIPIHLLTLEAFELYVRHLRPGGLLAVHVSTVHLKLAPLVHRLGLRTGLYGIFVVNLRNNQYFSRGSKWVLLSREESTLRELMAFGVAHKKRLGLADKDLRFYSPTEDDLADAPMWTDDYSDLFSVIKVKSLF